MKKHIMGIAALLIFHCIGYFPLYAQEEINHTIISSNQKEISEISKIASSQQQLIIKADPDNFANNLIPKVDYTEKEQIFHIFKKLNFSAQINDAVNSIDEDVMNSTIKYHKIGKENYSFSNILSCTLGGTSFDNVKCIIVHDTYKLIRLNSNIIYKYENTYLYFFDQKTNEFIGNINYINRTVGALYNEYKTIYLNPEYKSALQNNANALSISPNPAQSHVIVTIVLESNSSTTLQIINASGEIVKKVFVNIFLQAGQHSFTVNVSDLPSNTYFIKLLSENLSLSKPLIIN